MAGKVPRVRRISGRPAMASYAAPLKECDVIMKGGITSGIVYP
jgi:hypothetical protein